MTRIFQIIMVLYEIYREYFSAESFKPINKTEPISRI